MIFEPLRSGRLMPSARAVHAKRHWRLPWPARRSRRWHRNSRYWSYETADLSNSPLAWFSHCHRELSLGQETKKERKKERNTRNAKITKNIRNEQSKEQNKEQSINHPVIYYGEISNCHEVPLEAQVRNASENLTQTPQSTRKACRAWA